MGPSPDRTSTSLGFVLSLGGVSFSLSSRASDGGAQLFGVLVVELTNVFAFEGSVVDVLSPVCKTVPTQ